ncbi:hypothetical protein L3Q65_28090 [Amycolatopsis sp. FU40]|uniref:hypothetical protein n=1 Tax=Amycolatopsis sp. FU40 TaxID=2914159 RepID=UPI001F37AD39|nr:hypothetical protein [Amycolatopsis sp. FU40]UKD51783.1 hypothetical protein L3Q65_28090 [Amycolatopsis sp. FU40]
MAQRTKRIPAGVVLAIGFAVLLAVRETAFLIWPIEKVLSVSPGSRWDAIDALSLTMGYVPADDGTMSVSMLSGLVSQVFCGICCLAGAMLLTLRVPLGRTFVLLGAGSRLLIVVVAFAAASVRVDGSRVLDGWHQDPLLVVAFVLFVDWLLPLLVCAFATGRRVRLWVWTK